MNNYYFTFGQDNYTKHGVPMNDYYVTVKAESYSEAREKFVANFSSKIMARGADNWAFQYIETQFDSSWYVYGEFCVIE